MLNEAQISLTGYVATQPVTRLVKEGVTNVSMRVAWTPRRLRKGDPVMIKGRLSVRSYEDKEGRPRTSVEVDATSVGHDLNRGVATFQRIRPQTGMTASEFAAAQNAASGGEGSDGAGSNGQAADGAASVGGGFGSEDRGLAFAGSGESGQQVPDEPASFFDESAISAGTEPEEAVAAA